MDDREQTTQKAIINFVSCVCERERRRRRRHAEEEEKLFFILFIFFKNPPAAVSFNMTTCHQI
jgi:hypothetical protein